MKPPYSAPSLSRLGRLENLPRSLKGPGLELLKKASLTAVTTRDHHWLDVSEPFAQLLGYSVKDLVGKTVDEFTSPGSIDIEFAFDACFRMGEGEGMWLFDRRNGSRILVNYHARVSDQQAFARFRPLLITETWTLDATAQL